MTKNSHIGRESPQKSHQEGCQEAPQGGHQEIQEIQKDIILVAPPSLYRDNLALSWTNQNIDFKIQEPSYHADHELAFPPLRENLSSDPAQTHWALFHFPLSNPADTLLSTLFWAHHFHVQKICLPYIPYSRNKDIFQFFLKACPQTILTFDFHDCLWVQNSLTEQRHRTDEQLDHRFDPKLEKTPDKRKDNKKILNISCLQIFGSFLTAEIQETQSLGTQSQKEQPFLFAPDRGAYARLSPLAKKFNLPLISGKKIRQNNGHCIIHLSPKDQDFCKGKKAYIIEDMVSSGQTLLSSIQLLQESGVSALSAFVTHTLPESQTLFASTFQDILSRIDFYVTTDLHPVPETPKVTAIKILDKPYDFL